MKKSSIIVDFVTAYIILFSMLNIFPITTTRFVVDLKTFFSDIDLWSIQLYQFENFQLRLFFFVSILLLAVPKVNMFVFDQLKKIKFPKKLFYRFILFLIISTLFFIVFFKFQTKKPIGATGVFEMMLENDLMFINSNPLSTFFNYLLFNLLNGFMNSWSFIAFVSNISGFLFVFFLFVLSDNLYKRNIKKLIFFAFIMTQGIVFLFFGDHDVHSQQLAGILLYFLFSVLYLRNKCDITLPALFFSIASLLHLSTIILAPSLFFLPVLKSNKYLKHPIVNFFESLFSKESLKIVLGLILPFIIFWFFVYLPNQNKTYGPIYGDAFGGGDGTMFVPLFNMNTVYENYTFFSSQHLMDKLNLLLFMFPVGSILWAALLVDNWRDLKKDKLGVFFLICCLLGLVFIVLWNPDFGAKLDYNLFSPAILAMCVFTSYNLSSNLNKEYYPYITILALFVSLFHLLPIVVTTA